MQQFKNLLDLQEYFSSELVCAQYLENQRWEGKPACPHCGSEHHYRTKTRLKHPELGDYKDFVCKACMKKYTVLTGTIYESSKVSLRKWLTALYLVAAHKKPISSLQLAEDLSVTQKTAWYMMHRIRESLQEVAPELLAGDVCADETFVGGKNKNRHWDKKVENSRGRSFKDKTPVLGILQKGEGIRKPNGKMMWSKISKVRCFVIPDTKAISIQPLVFDNVALKSKLHTDEWLGYTGMRFHYQHLVVDHGRGQYKSGEACTNPIEGFWTQVKRGLNGTYHSVKSKHLQRYCFEFAFRFNHRNLTVIERFEAAVKKCEDGRLLYKVLTS